MAKNANRFLAQLRRCVGNRSLIMPHCFLAVSLRNDDQNGQLATCGDTTSLDRPSEMGVCFASGLPSKLAVRWHYRFSSFVAWRQSAWRSISGLPVPFAPISPEWHRLYVRRCSRRSQQANRNGHGSGGDVHIDIAHDTHLLAVKSGAHQLHACYG